MGLRTWEAKVGDRKIGIKAKKDLARSFAGKLSDLYRIHHYTRKTSGIKGVDERTTDYMSLFTPSEAPVRDEAAFLAKREEFEAGLPEVINVEDMAGILERSREIFNEHIPVKDTRQTPEEHAALIAEGKAAEEKRKKERDEKHREFLTKLAQPDENGEYSRVPVPDGMMPIVASVRYDDSDPMTDYFNSHAQVGVSLLLALVPKQARKESIARAAAALYPQLQGQGFTWHTENYSMGHGNYLDGTATDELTFSAHLYRGGGKAEPISCRWQIEFGYGNELYPILGYKGEGIGTADAPADSPTEGAEMRFNEAKGGVELRFASRPERELLNNLKAHGWRWAKRNRCWYIRKTDEAVEFAQTIIGKVGQPIEA